MAAMKTMKRTWRLALALALSAGLLLAGIVQAEQKQLSIGTGDPGGVYFPLGGAVASVLAKSLPDLHTTVEVTGGSVDNIKLICDRPERPRLHHGRCRDGCNAGPGQIQEQQDRAADAACRLSEPHACRDHRGQPISRRSPTSRASTSRPARPAAPPRSWPRAPSRLIGLDKDKDIQRERLGVAESVNALTDRGSMPSSGSAAFRPPRSANLATTAGVKMKLIDNADLVDKMNEKYGKLYSKSRIKAGTYSGTRTDATSPRSGI